MKLKTNLGVDEVKKPSLVDVEEQKEQKTSSKSQRLHCRAVENVLQKSAKYEYTPFEFRCVYAKDGTFVRVRAIPGMIRALPQLLAPAFTIVLLVWQLLQMDSVSIEERLVPIHFAALIVTAHFVRIAAVLRTAYALSMLTPFFALAAMLAQTLYMDWVHEASDLISILRTNFIVFVSMQVNRMVANALQQSNAEHEMSNDMREELEQIV